MRIIPIIVVLLIVPSVNAYGWEFGDFVRGDVFLYDICDRYTFDAHTALNDKCYLASLRVIDGFEMDYGVVWLIHVEFSDSEENLLRDILIVDESFGVKSLHHKYISDSMANTLFWMPTHARITDVTLEIGNTVHGSPEMNDMMITDFSRDYSSTQYTISSDSGDSIIVLRDDLYLPISVVNTGMMPFDVNLNSVHNELEFGADSGDVFDYGTSETYNETDDVSFTTDEFNDDASNDEFYVDSIISHEDLLNEIDLIPLDVNLTNDDVNPDINDDVNPDINDDVNPDINDDVNPDINDDVNPDINDDVNPDINDDVNPDINDDVNPDINDDVNPDINTTTDDGDSGNGDFFGWLTGIFSSFFTSMESIFFAATSSENNLDDSQIVDNVDFEIQSDQISNVVIQSENNLDDSQIVDNVDFEIQSDQISNVVIQSENNLDDSQIVDNVDFEIQSDQISNVVIQSDNQIVYYSFENVPSVTDKQIPINALKKAIETWEANNTNLEFIQSENPNIEIRWQVYSSSTHTGFATCYDLECILDISLGTDDCNGNFIQSDEGMVTNILMHEIGHSLGLGHTSETGQLMFSTESPEISFDTKGYVIPDRFEELYVGQKALLQQEKEIRAELESLDIKILPEQSQYDEYYKQYAYYEGKILSPDDYEKAQIIYNNVNSATEKLNSMIDQQNQLIDQLDEIVMELVCTKHYSD